MLNPAKSLESTTRGSRIHRCSQGKRTRAEADEDVADSPIAVQVTKPIAFIAPISSSGYLLFQSQSAGNATRFGTVPKRSIRSSVSAQSMVKPLALVPTKASGITNSVVLLKKHFGLSKQRTLDLA